MPSGASAKLRQIDALAPEDEIRINNASLVCLVDHRKAPTLSIVPGSDVPQRVAAPDDVPAGHIGAPPGHRAHALHCLLPSAFCSLAAGSNGDLTRGTAHSRRAPLAVPLDHRLPARGRSARLGRYGRFCFSWLAIGCCSAAMLFYAFRGFRRLSLGE